MTDMIDRTLTRASLIRGGAAAGVGLAVGGLTGVSPSFASGATQGDIEILIAAQIAEALAVTTYTDIINTAPFFTRLEDDDQGYLKAARQEEMSHYLLEQSVTGKPSPFTFSTTRPKMFEDAADYAERARHARGRVHRRLPRRRARLLDPRPAGHGGADHGHRERPPHARARRRPRRRAPDGGPIENVTGIQAKAESVDPPNNNGYERTLRLDHIGGPSPR